MTKTLMTEEWVSLWYQCLSGNIDYGLYCNARDSGNTATCKAMEARFDRLAEIYEDFGAMDGWSDDPLQEQRWKQWFEPRKHLFISEPTHVVDPGQHRVESGHLLLDIPLDADVRRTSESVNNFLLAHYERQPLMLAPRPKYALHLANGRLGFGLKPVKQACISAARSYRYDNEFEERRFVDAVTEFVRHELDNMGWTLDPKARKKLMEEGTLSEERLDSFKAMLTRCRRDFMALSRNTIRGRFPDKTPFESTVIDLF